MKPRIRGLTIDGSAIDPGSEPLHNSPDLVRTLLKNSKKLIQLVLEGRRGALGASELPAVVGSLGVPRPRITLSPRLEGLEAHCFGHLAWVTIKVVHSEVDTNHVTHRRLALLSEVRILQTAGVARGTHEALRSKPQAHDHKTGRIMELLVHELESQLCVERSAQWVPFEHLDFKLSAQLLGSTHERSADSSAMECRIDEEGAYLVPK